MYTIFTRLFTMDLDPFLEKVGQKGLRAPSPLRVPASTGTQLLFYQVLLPCPAPSPKLCSWEATQNPCCNDSDVPRAVRNHGKFGGESPKELTITSQYLKM